MRSRIEPLHVPNSGLIHLQNALNDLEEIAEAFRAWPGDPGRSPIDLLAVRGSDELKRLEMIEGLAELLQQPSEAGQDASSSRLEDDLLRAESVGPTSWPNVGA
jgi:hypothetical protein